MLDIDRDRQRISLGPQADPGGPLAADRQHLQRRRRARGQGHQGRHVRRVRRDPRRRRGARAHLRARAAPRREPARDRPAGRRDPRQDPRDRLRAPAAVAVGQARRGPDPAGAPRSGEPDGEPSAEAEADARAGASRRGWRRRGTPPSRARRREAAAAPRSRAGRRREAEAAEAPPAVEDAAPIEAAAPRPSAPRRRRARSRRRRGAGRGDEPPPRRAEPTTPAAEAGAADGAERRRRVRSAGLTRLSSRAREAAVPFVGLTGGWAPASRRRSRRCERLGAAVLSSDAVVHELYDDRRRCATRCVARFGARGRARRRGRSRGASRGARSRRRRTARGSRAAVAAGRRARRSSGSREARAREPAAARGRRRGAAAVRGRRWSAATTRRSRSSPRSALRTRARRRAAGTSSRRARPRASCRRRRRRAGDVRRAQRRHRARSSSASCRRSCQARADEPRAALERSRRSRCRASCSSALIVAAGVQRVVRDLTLPLDDASVIREQAADKHLDPALIAAVIYAETKFDPRTSSAGAHGLMQIVPATAYFLAQLLRRQSLHGQRPRARRAINIAYGSYYLRYLLDHYDGNEMLALAAYNGGKTNVDGWVAQAQRERAAAHGRRDPVPARRAPTCSACSSAPATTYRATTTRRCSGRTLSRARPPTRAAPLTRLRSTQTMPDFKLDSVFTPDRRPAAGDRAARRGRRARRALPDAARRDRHGQDDDDGGRDRGGAAPDARDRAQQDARRAAVQRVPHVLPRQRGRVLRLLLRLLPARGLRPEPRPLHREGLGDQPGGRPPAPRRDRGGVRAPRRDRRRVGVVHLRPRLAGDLREEHADPAGAARRSTATRCCASSSRSSTPATTACSRAARFRVRGETLEVFPAYAETAFRATLFGDEVERLSAVRPAHRRADRRRPRARRDLAGDALQRQGGHDRARPSRRSARELERALRAARVRGQAARVPPPAPAHAVRHGDAARGRLLLGDRELLADPRRPQAGRAAVLPDRLLPRATSSASSTSPTRRCRRSAACTRATARASRRSSTTASGCRARSTTARRRSRSSSRSRRSWCSCRRRPGEYERTRSTRVVEQIVRPTGIVDPAVEVRETRNQIDDLMNEVRVRVRPRRARAGDDADQEDGRGPLRLPAGDGLQDALPALGDRHARAHPDHPRPAARRVRRARRRQPAARGPRPAGGLARRDPRRRQGGLPARRDLADPDDRPRRAQRRRARC